MSRYADVRIGEGTLIHETVTIEPFTVIRNDVIIRDSTWIKEFCAIYDDVEIGRSCKIRAQCVICEKAKIGNFCEFGVGVILMDHYKMVAYLNEDDEVKAPVIGIGCRIGTGTQIHAGAIIMDNVILLPNSIVREDETIPSGMWGMQKGKLKLIRSLKEEEKIEQ